MKYFSYHTHSSFCDGKASVEEVCISAIKQGLSSIGFSSHAPVMFETAWAMRFEDLSAYVEEVERCKIKYKDQIKIYRSLEADYIGEGKSIPFHEWRKLGQLDYLIGSVHLVTNPAKRNGLWFLDGPSTNYDKGIKQCFDGDARRAVEQYYAQIREMVQVQKPDVIAHMDKVVMNNKKDYFSESNTWYKDAMEETLQVIAASSVIVEVNTRGIYRGKYHTWFPNENVIQRCVELDIPLTVSVDAHHPSELCSGFQEAATGLKASGCKYLSVYEDEVWKQIPISDVISDN
ncbi:histidinol-phosphatase [Carboxylicivirga mesophila]|uniref:Histidinol-phosphatase n=1 Tax=Carboxylicivirga mesophila TaxID=1166478 RepID=A0ABS5KBH3_9BACT|nr:histidinol-phosphatase [Carboxylicivirga mesophila]MBS2212383.1 histidinol-phosphatase [Carboxylicivirga mesophila]